MISWIFFQVAAIQCWPTCNGNTLLWEIEFLWFLWYLYIRPGLIFNLSEEDSPIPNHHPCCTIWHQYFDLQIIKWTLIFERFGGFKVVLQGYPRCPNGHAAVSQSGVHVRKKLRPLMAAENHLPPISITVSTLTPKNHLWLWRTTLRSWRRTDLQKRTVTDCHLRLSGLMDAR